MGGRREAIQPQKETDREMKPIVRLFALPLLLLTVSCAPGAPTSVPPSGPIQLPPPWTPTPTFPTSPTPKPLPTARPIETATARPTWIACVDARPSRLRVGDLAYVSTEPDLPNRLRSSPGTRGSSVVGQLDPRSPLTIIGGPRCDDGMVWWQIDAHDKGLVGWTSEGDIANYWLIPLEPTPSAPQTDY